MNVTQDNDPRAECGGYCHCCAISENRATIRIAGIIDREGTYYGALCDPCYNDLITSEGAVRLAPDHFRPGSQWSQSSSHLPRVDVFHD